MARALQSLVVMTGSSNHDHDDEIWRQERERLLRTKISDLGLRIENTALRTLVERLYRELEDAGIRFKPPVYLADEWACPDGVPLIGIPFYLADPRLIRLEEEMMDGVEAQSDEDVLALLRHEAGHAFNYAYKLYEREEWQRVFGRYDLPYHDDYSPRPFSRAFVRHLPAWYAQKHPDEDFAETFAVWLAPESRWREVYRDWAAYPKLLYVERVMKEIGEQAPLVTADDYDASGELDVPLELHYRRMLPAAADLPPHFDDDLLRIFRRSVGERAGDEAASTSQRADAFLHAHRRSIVLDVSYWTGLYDVKVRALVQHLIDRCHALGLGVHAESERTALIDFVAFVTTLCMNKLYKGEFVLE